MRRFSMRRTVTGTLAFVSSVLAMGTPAFAATHVVKNGDTLWSIATNWHMSVTHLEAVNPGVTPTTLRPGMVLRSTLPEKSKPASSESTKLTYIVRSGDTLWSIAHNHHIAMSTLRKLNPNVDWTRLQIGTHVTIRQSSINKGKAQSGSKQSAHLAVKSPTSVSRSTASGSSASVDPQNLYWMAHVIQAEAGSQPFAARVAVGDVVWHRMHASGFPKTVHDVVFQVSGGHYQFGCVANGSIYEAPNATSEAAALQVLKQHTDYVPGAYVFYSTSAPKDSWNRQQPFVKQIGQMVFAK